MKTLKLSILFLLAVIILQSCCDKIPPPKFSAEQFAWTPYKEGDTMIFKSDSSEETLSFVVESVFHSGIADLNLKTFAVKSNGKTGLDIRYFFNPVKDEVSGESLEPEVPGTDGITTEDIPF